MTDGVHSGQRSKFAEAYVHPDGFVAWPGGQDLAPDAMYDDIKKSGRRIAGGREDGSNRCLFSSE